MYTDPIPEEAMFSGINPQTQQHVVCSTKISEHPLYITHSVTTYPGSCGSVLLVDGKIVGMHYGSAGNNTKGDNNFAISLVKPVK